MAPRTITSYSLAVNEHSATITVFSSESPEVLGRSWQARLQYSSDSDSSSFTDRGGALVFNRPIELLAPALHVLANSDRVLFSDNGSLWSHVEEPITASTG